MIRGQIPSYLPKQGHTQVVYIPDPHTRPTFTSATIAGASLMLTTWPWTMYTDPQSKMYTCTVHTIVHASVHVGWQMIVLSKALSPPLTT